ncbi:MAG: EAL domain-containing protein [Bacillota bacterium]
MKKLLQSSISRRIMILFLFVTVFITLLFIILSAQLSNSYLSSLVNEQGKVVVQTYSITISRWFQERHNDLVIYADNDHIKNFNWGHIEPFLKKEHQRFDDIYNLLFVADSEGNYYATNSSVGNISDRPYFKQVMEGEVAISDPLISKATGSNIIVIAVPIKKEDNVVGLLGATIELETLSNYINKFRLDYYNAISFIMNAEGEYITHPYKRYILKENMSSATLNIEAEKYKDMNGTILKQSGSFQYVNNGDSSILYYHKIDVSTDWYFVARVPEEFVHSYIVSAARRLLIIGLICIIIALILSFFISKNIANPIIKLKETFEKASQGDLNVRSDIKRSDEIGEAAESFNQMMNTLNHITYYDSRTGLPNRRYLDNTLRVLCSHAKANNEKFALITLNINQYNNIVDSMGHVTGDKLISLIANRLDDISSKLKAFSWIEGQFVLVLTEINETRDIYKYIRFISRSVNKKWRLKNIDFHLSCSMGIAVYPENGSDRNTLLKNSSLALHKIIDQSGLNYQFYSSEMNKKLIEEIKLDNELRQALKQQQFILYYQPQYDIYNNKLTGLEALIRWNHPRQGLISPGRFIPVTEENGMIVELGEWVLKEACRQNVRWIEKGFPRVKIAVNIATPQLMEDSFVKKVKKILDKTGMPAELLEIEITERTIITDIEKIIVILNELREMGLSIALDDFGTGYSSLQYIKDFALNHLKIDMSFIRQLFDKKGNQEIVKAIIATGHSLNFRVTAEGVEKQNQLDFLKDNKCDFVQGYFYSRPVPPEGIEELFRENNN